MKAEVERSESIEPNVADATADAVAEDAGDVKGHPIGVLAKGAGVSTRTVRYYEEIGLLHTSLDGRPGHADYAPCSVEGLRSKGYAYWALGHVHQREEVSHEPWIAYPGNVQGRHAKETGTKGCSLVTVENGRVARVDAPRQVELSRNERGSGNHGEQCRRET